MDTHTTIFALVAVEHMQYVCSPTSVTMDAAKHTRIVHCRPLHYQRIVARQATVCAYGQC